MKHLIAATAIALVSATGALAEGMTLYVAIHVDENDPQLHNMALNNAVNMANYYESQGDEVVIELVAYGPGLHMFREDTSPVTARIEALQLEMDNLSFAACGNTLRAMNARMESGEVELIAGVDVTPSGVVRLVELQEQGYAYIRP
jgi:intracellular sulfur oxidation DsrE/DsrF family protein